MMLLTGILQVLGAEPIPLVFERLPLDIRSNEFYKRGLAWQFRTEENDEIYEVKHSICYGILARFCRGCLRERTLLVTFEVCMPCIASLA